jgi:hypothetical protein
VPSVIITVADIPASSKEAMSSRIAWNSAASFFETGSSLMSVNALVGNAGASSVGVGDATGETDG